VVIFSLLLYSSSVFWNSSIMQLTQTVHCDQDVQEYGSHWPITVTFSSIQEGVQFEVAAWLVTITIYWNLAVHIRREVRCGIVKFLFAKFSRVPNQMHQLNLYLLLMEDHLCTSWRLVCFESCDNNVQMVSFTIISQIMKQRSNLQLASRSLMVYHSQVMLY